ncbi:MAG: GAF domain-containing protein, partial [Candidatus Eisenbacteria bacterium]
MSLPFAFLAAALVSLVLPVAAVLLRVRTRSGLVWEVLSCSLAAAFYLTAVMRLLAQGHGPVPTIWLHALMASPVLLLLAGFMLTLSLGRVHPARSLLESYPTLALLAVPGAVALSLLRDPAFISGYDWEGGRATIHLGYAGKAYAGYLLIGVVLIGHNLERTYRFASPLDRRHLRGALLALCCVFGFATFVLTTGLLFSSVGLTSLAFAGLPIALAGALVAHGLLRGGLAEAAVDVPQGHGGLSFTTVAAGLFMLFIAGASQLAALIDGSPAAILVVAAGALAILIAIVLTFSESSHRKVRCLIDRSLYANHRDVRTQWSRTAESLRDAADCETLLDRTAAMCAEAFGADAVTIALENEAAPGFSPVRGKGASGRPMVLEPDSPLPRQLGRGRCAMLLHRRPHDLAHVAIHAENQDWLGETASQMIAPLLDGTRLVGTIGLERQARRAAFTCEDLALLDSMAFHVATVLSSIRRAEDRILIREGELISKWSNTLLHETRLLHAPLERALADLPLFGHIPGVSARSAADISRAAVRLEGWGRTFAALRNHSPLAMSVASPNEIVRESLSRFQIRGTASIE